nr:MAG TPA: hypothetical protein [Caudoviricetes sp.]
MNNGIEPKHFFFFLLFWLLGTFTKAVIEMVCGF